MEQQIYQASVANYLNYLFLIVCLIDLSVLVDLSVLLDLSGWELLEISVALCKTLF